MTYNTILLTGGAADTNRAIGQIDKLLRLEMGVIQDGEPGCCDGNPAPVETRLIYNRANELEQITSIAAAHNLNISPVPAGWGDDVF